MARMTRLPHWTLAAALVAAAAATLAACGTSGTTGTSGTPGSSSAAPATRTRTVVDMAGRHVQIPKTVTRVATNIPLIPPTIYLLGGMNKLVAEPSTASTPLLETIDPKVKDIAQFPVTTINSEALLKTRPQVFIMTSLTPGLLPQLKRLGIPVVEIGNENSSGQLSAMVNVVASVLGGNAPARAQRFDAYYSGAVKQIQAKTASLAASAKPAVYYAPGPNATTTVGTGNIITDSISEAGGRNIAAEHGVGASAGSFAFPTITTETLVSWNPQVIVAISPKVAKLFTTDPRYATLSAVRDHQVYACPSGVFAWCASSAESALQPQFLAATLHPKLFGNLDLATVTRNFYSTFYNYKLSSQQVATILSGSGK